MSDAARHNESKRHLFENAASLDGIFSPKSVALVHTGLPGELGDNAISTFLNGGFQGKSFVIQPGSPPAPDTGTYTRLSDVPSKVDLAIAVTSAEEAPAVLADCVQHNVKGVVLLSPRLGTHDAYSPEAAAQMRNILGSSRTRVIGPGALGVMNPLLGLNATPGLPMPMGGTVAFLCESPLLGRVVLDWSLKHLVGFSSFACVGSMLDVSWANLIDYFGGDPNTRTIALQISSVGDARALVSAAREVSLNKPIIVIKAGLDGHSVRALTWKSRCQSSDSLVFTAALERVGVVQVETIDDLFYAADALSKQPRPRGPRLMLVSNADGPAVLAADSLARAGVQLASPSDETRSQVQQLLVEQNTLDDVLGDSSAENYVAAAKLAINDPNCDGVLLLLVPWALADPQLTAGMLLELRNSSKPILISYFGAPDSGSAQEALIRACIPTFSTPEVAARVFQSMWRYSYELQALYETPMLHAEGDSQTHDFVHRLILQARSSGRTSLSPLESAEVLAKYGIATFGPNVSAAPDRNGGRVKLGFRLDPQFGAYLMFGSADRGPGVYGDVAIGLPPLNATLARRMLEKSAFYRGLLHEYQSDSLRGLEEFLVRFSHIASDQPLIKEFEVEGLISPSDVLAISSRCMLHAPSTKGEDLPRPAIRPYPVQYVSLWQMKNGQTVTMRPIRAEDEPLMVKFHERLSDHSVYMRYFQRVKLSTRTAHQRLSRVCFLDYDREFALLAEVLDPHTDDRRIVAVATLIKSPQKSEGEVAVLISDDCQRQGLGKELIRRLIGFAQDEGLRRVVASTMLENLGMSAVFEKLGFQLSTDFEEELVNATLSLHS
jgi:acetyltransferase